MSGQAQPGGSTVADVMAAADFRAAMRRFARTNERIARSFGLTPQRYMLLLKIKGAPDRTGSSRR